MLAKLRNGGAACTAANRFYAARSVAKEFTEQLTDAMSKIKMASGLTEGAQLGASVSVKERDKIADLVDSSVKQGGKVTLGGTKPQGDGAFYPPTVITVASDNPILKEEIFGPVAVVVIVDSDEEAIHLANDTEYGSSAISIRAPLIEQSESQRRWNLEWLLSTEVLSLTLPLPLVVIKRVAWVVKVALMAFTNSLRKNILG